jgi:cytochrome P450
MAGDLPSASLVDSLRFNQEVILPNALQGLFRRRRKAQAAATKLGVDGRAVGLVGKLRDRHGPGPVWVNVMGSRALLLLSVDDVRRVLEGSPDPFASDPEAKRRGMGHFQPHALTLSRGKLWEARRKLTEEVLDTAKPVHRMADRFLAITREEVEMMLAEIAASGGNQLDYDAFHRCFRFIVRRLILGDAARDDERISEMLAELMDEANKLPKEPPDSYELFATRLGEYVTAAEPGSLVALIREVPAEPEVEAAGQVPHWIFALQDTLAANALRCLALIASHPVQREKVAAEMSGAVGVAGLNYLGACLQEAMRLWPTTPLLSRETLAEVRFNGDTVPAGSQVFIHNTFFHRDPKTHDYADRFAPEEWTEGDAASDWSFNHFSHGPQGCPGAGIALFVGKALLATLLNERTVELREPTLDPGRPLPHMLDYFQLRFELTPKGR